MKKLLGFLAVCSMFLGACGKNSIAVTKEDPNSPEKLEGLELVCSSSSNGNSLSCTTGQTLPLPPTFPNSKDCNQCITKVEGGVATVKCPNGLQFSFTLIKGADGKDGKDGTNGTSGKDGKDGSSCTVTLDGWVKCTDGSAYKLLQGPKGDTGATGAKGETGAKGATGNTGATGATGATGPQGPAGKDGKDGGSCHVSVNSYGQTVITCDDGSTEVVTGCGGYGCWSFGAKANVISVPSSTTTIPNLNGVTFEESVVTPQFDVFDRQSSLGYPGMPHRQTWFAIRYEGFIEVPACPSNNCKYRLTSDDGSIFSIDGVVVVNHDGLHSPSSKVGSISALPGWHTYRLDYLQGPSNQIALALEQSVDGGVTFQVVAQDQLKFLVQ